MINNQKTSNATKFTSSLVADDFITTYPYLSFLNIIPSYGFPNRSHRRYCWVFGDCARPEKRIPLSKINYSTDRKRKRNFSRCRMPGKAWSEHKKTWRINQKKKKKTPSFRRLIVGWGDSSVVVVRMILHDLQFHFPYPPLRNNSSHCAMCTHSCNFISVDPENISRVMYYGTAPVPNKQTTLGFRENEIFLLCVKTTRLSHENN